MQNNRLFRILYYILERGKVTATDLAEKFEVSVRTIYRDVDSLSSAGIPIYTTQGKGGGIEIAEDFVLRKSLLTAEEKEQIMAALQGLDSTSHLYQSDLLTKLSALFQVKNSNWIEIDFNHWQNDKAYEESFHQLKTAILGKHLVSFSYLASDGQETNRRVKPVRLFFKSQNWYLYAFCLLRQEFRYFKLSRMKNLERLEERFEDSFEDVVLEKELAYENTIKLAVKFDRKVAFRVYDELGGDIRTDAEGNLYTEIEIPNDQRLYSYILSFADAVEVLDPPEIRVKMKEMIHKLAEKYKT